MKYVEPRPIPREEVAAVLAAGDVAAICDMLVGVAFHEPDRAWAEDLFLAQLASTEPDIARLSATCLGHLARIHGEIDHDKVSAAFAAAEGRSPEIDDAIENARSDIAMFTAP